MLFSEPKIPQLSAARCSRHTDRRFQCSSASRKFLNDRSFSPISRTTQVSVLFSEPKIPQLAQPLRRRAQIGEFQCSSASRKFLNRSYTTTSRAGCQAFQCSSASRKFLNVRCPTRPVDDKRRFSALQRAENSSIPLARLSGLRPVRSFSALQRAENSSIDDRQRAADGRRCRFQCSSASRKFLNHQPRSA